MPHRADSVFTPGAGIGDTVLQIARSYNVQGQIQNVTSYDSASGGDVVNDIQYQYNGFGQVTAEYQSHSGPVNTSSTPAVQYSYANGSANTARLTGTTYPSGGVATYDYGTSGEDGDMLSRVSSISFGSTSMVEYTYLGLKTFVQTEYPQPAIRNDLAFGTGANPYPGLDNFGRVIDCRWRTAETGSDVERIQYGYDRVGNRLWRHNTVAPTGSGNDELYSYDGLYRLVDFNRGELSPEPTSGGQASYSPTIAGTTLTQQWLLDATGNWSSFVNSDALNPSDSVNQARTHSMANEIVTLAASYGATWAQPSYDAAGNMVVFPQPASPTYGFTATYDAWNRQMSVVGVSQYAYDGTNRRITKTVGNTVDDYYYSSNWQVLEDRQLIASTAQPTAQFIWGQRYIDDLVCRVIGSENLYALQDANWNVTAIIDSSGVLQERYRYQAYGTPEFLLPSFDETSAAYGSFAWETLYASYRFDPELGTYRVRHRELHPLVGVWMARDPLGYRGRASLYAAVLGRPTVVTDPLGLFEVEWEGTWTASQMGRVTTSFGNVAARIPVLQKQIAAELATLSKCVRGKIGGVADDLSATLNCIAGGIASTDQNLEIYHYDFGGGSDAGAEMRNGGFFSSFPSFIYNDPELRFNDGIANGWQTSPQADLDQTVLHELSHWCGTVDDPNLDSFADAHTLDDLMAGSFAGHATWRLLKQRAQKDCDEC